ncbi:OB-fold domain-containing protein [Candidatus Bipolaricaulota bacterium]|nr:OB-fold domain-containing protein [Candidatus Bipolaricaulota bacterium]
MIANVTGMKCNACGTVSYPKHMVCPKCRGERFTDVVIEGEGTVLTYTDVYALAIEYETRYLRLAIVELDGGVRVTGQLLADKPKLGMRVRTILGIVRQGGEGAIQGLQFVAV